MTVTDKGGAPIKPMFLNDWYQQYKKSSESFRAKYLTPVLHLLAILKITPNQITIGRLLFIIPIAWYFYEENLSGVLVCYLIFWLLDLFDGALARYLNKQNDKGRFLDTLVDNFMYGILMVGMIHLQVAWLWLLAANIVLEYTAQILSMIYKQWGVPSDFIIKAQADLPYFKSVSHAGLFLFYLGFDYLNIIFYLLDIGLAVTAGYYFYKLKPKFNH
jgi:phosphatidylglycerophosphate synthase